MRDDEHKAEKELSEYFHKNNSESIENCDFRWVSSFIYIYIKTYPSSES